MRIDSAEDFLPAMRAAIKILKLGKAIYINPEGTRSETGELLPFRAGVGVLAVESGAPIVPVYIGGTFHALPSGSFFPRPARISVSFGKPILMDEFEKKKESEMAYQVYKEVTDQLFERVRSLKVRDEKV